MQVGLGLHRIHHFVKLLIINDYPFQQLSITIWYFYAFCFTLIFKIINIIARAIIIHLKYLNELFSEIFGFNAFIVSGTNAKINANKPRLIVPSSKYENICVPSIITSKTGKIMDFNFMFDSFDELKEFLTHIDDGTIEADLSRWVFFN